MLSANLSNTRNVLREKTLNYINAPLNEYMVIITFIKKEFKKIIITR